MYLEVMGHYGFIFITPAFQDNATVHLGHVVRPLLCTSITMHQTMNMRKDDDHTETAGFTSSISFQSIAEAHALMFDIRCGRSLHFEGK